MSQICEFISSRRLFLYLIPARYGPFTLSRNSKSIQVGFISKIIRIFLSRNFLRMVRSKNLALTNSKKFQFKSKINY